MNIMLNPMKLKLHAKPSPEVMHIIFCWHGYCFSCAELRTNHSTPISPVCISGRFLSMKESLQAYSYLNYSAAGFALM
jgi:hypothetical protein